MIPKKVHVSWVDPSVKDADFAIVQQGIRRLIDLNPDWDVRFYDNEEPVEYLKEALGSTGFRLFDGSHIVEKLDTWRLLKLHEEGGIYVDLDRLCNVKLNDVIKEGIKCVLPTSRNFDFSQDLMISAPKNPLFQIAVELQLQRRWEGSKNTYFLGPQTYMHAVTKALTGEMINTDPGEDVMNQLRQHIVQTGFLDTYIEEGPLNTFLFRGSTVEFDHEAEKRKLYAAYNLRHWTDEW